MQLNRSGELVVRAPLYMPQFVIDRFVRQHEGWIAKQKKVRSQPQPELMAHFASKNELEKYIKEQVEHFAQITNLHPSNIRFRSVKTYWGSCSPQGVISFNYHLIHTPQEAVDYVIVHELCHLKYRGHGKRFWQLVERHFPRANEMRRVLRQIPRA
jgi:predicted metal-dependent hydrolase